MSKQRTCIFCGKEYQYCPNCKDYSSYPTWMFNFDTEKCRDLYNVMGGYNIGIRTIEDVKATLDKHGVTDYSIFPKALQEKLSGSSLEIKDEPKIEANDEPKVEIKDEPEIEVNDEPKVEPKKEVVQESNQKKQEFTKGNKNYVSRKMKKNNYGRRDGE